MESCSPDFLSEIPSTSKNTSQNAIAVIEPEELIDINRKVNFILDKLFQNKSEIIVNRRVFEEIISETLEQPLMETYINMKESKHLSERFNANQNRQTKLNRHHYDLKEMVENASKTIKSLIKGKEEHNHRIIQGVRPILPSKMKRQVRSVGVQAYLTGFPLFNSKKIINYSTSVTNHNMENILSPEEPSTNSKFKFNKEVDAMNNKLLTYQFTKVNQHKSSYYQPAQKKGSKFNSTTNRISTIKTKINEVEFTKNKSQVKIKSLNELNEKGKHVKQMRKVQNKGFENQISAESKKEKYEDLIIKDDKICEYSTCKEDNENITKGGKEYNKGFENLIPRENAIDRKMSKRKAKSPVKVEFIKDFHKRIKYEEHNNEDHKDFGSSISTVNKEEKVDAISTKELIISNGDFLIFDGLVHEIIEISKIEGTEQFIENGTFISELCVLKKTEAPAIIEDTKDFMAVNHEIKAEMNVDANDNSYPTSINQDFINGQSVATSSTTEGENRSLIPINTLIYQITPHASKPPGPILEVKTVFHKVLHVILMWRFEIEPPENILMYQLFFRPRSTYVWNKIDIMAKPLPMIYRLAQFVENETYYFTIRAVDSQLNQGYFSAPIGVKVTNLNPSLNTSAGIMLNEPSSQE